MCSIGHTRLRPDSRSTLLPSCIQITAPLCSTFKSVNYAGNMNQTLSVIILIFLRYSVTSQHVEVRPVSIDVLAAQLQNYTVHPVLLSQVSGKARIMDNILAGSHWTPKQLCPMETSSSSSWSSVTKKLKPRTEKLKNSSKVRPNI